MVRAVCSNSLHNGRWMGEERMTIFPNQKLNGRFDSKSMNTVDCGWDKKEKEKRTNLSTWQKVDGIKNDKSISWQNVYLNSRVWNGHKRKVYSQGKKVNEMGNYNSIHAEESECDS